jgi:peroxiredoxin
MRSRSLCLLVGFLSLSTGCDSKSKAEPESQGAAAPSPSPEVGAEKIQQATTDKGAQAAQPTTGGSAQVGKPAPDFTLPDLDAKPVRLADFRGKTVVLEWFNPECPFVRAAHTKGSLVDAAARAEKDGVVWLAINSGAKGKQGHGADATRAGKEAFKLDHPILLDESGQVGRAYGAARTPHVFIIDDKGVLVYAGAADNSPDGEGQSAEGGTLVSYVDQALSELAAGKPISTPETKPYGCSVKY